MKFIACCAGLAHICASVAFAQVQQHPPATETNETKPGLASSEDEVIGKPSQHTLIQDLVIGVECEQSTAPFVIEEHDVKVSIRPLADLVVNQPLSLSLTVCGKQMAEAAVTLDASLPALGYRIKSPSAHEVVARSERGQQIHVEGVILHVPGQWQWRVNIAYKDSRRVLTRHFTVQ